MDVGTQEREVVAREASPGGRLWLFLAAQALVVATSGWRALHGDHPLVMGTLLLVWVVTLVGSAAPLVPALRPRLVLTPDALVLEHRALLRPRRFPRAGITAVDGDVPHRPDWSDCVLVTSGRRRARLGPFDVRPGVLVPRLRAWAGLPADALDVPPGG